MFIPHIIESLFVELIINNKPVIVGVIYRPNTPPKADLDVFMHSMVELECLLRTQHNDSYLVGDINIDLLKFSNNAKTNEYLENTFTHGFIPLITKPTRITPYSATLIDHLYTNKQQLNSTSGIILCDVSDHFGIFSIIRTSHKRTSCNKPIQSYRSYSTANTNSFIRLLDNTDFETVLQEPCPDKAYNHMMKLYTEAHNLAFPLKTTETPKKYKKHSPWITKGLIQSSLTQANLLLAKLENPTEANIQLYKTFITL